MTECTCCRGNIINTLTHWRGYITTILFETGGYQCLPYVYCDPNCWYADWIERSTSRYSDIGLGLTEMINDLVAP